MSKTIIRKRRDIEEEIVEKQLTDGMKIMLEVLLDIRINTSRIVSELQFLNRERNSEYPVKEFFEE